MSEKSKTEIISVNLIRAFVQFKRLRVDGNNPRFDRDESVHALKHSEIMLLFELKDVEKDYPNGISVSDISRYLCVKPPSITPIITSLEQKNMIERTMDTNDRRIIRVRMKEAGSKFIEENEQHMVSRIKGLVEYLGEEKSTTLADLINESFLFMSGQTGHKKQP
jgi:DNA-binding MarR family transcriptional regulator